MLRARATAEIRAPSGVGLRQTLIGLGSCTSLYGASQWMEQATALAFEVDGLHEHRFGALGQARAVHADQQIGVRTACRGCRLGIGVSAGGREDRDEDRDGGRDHGQGQSRTLGRQASAFDAG